MPEKRRAGSDFLEIASKELESLAQHMPNLSDIDARTLALRMYYIELSKGTHVLLRLMQGARSARCF